MKQSIAVFRADASPAIGGGHVMRCLSLADELNRAGWDIVFVCGRETLATVPAVARYRYRGLGEDETADAGAMRETVPEGCDLAIIDHYGLDVDFEMPLRGWASLRLAIDDLANRRHEVELLLDQTHGRQSADYTALVPGRCALLLGSRYALLRSRFRELRAQALATRDRSRVRKVLVSFGATDPRNFTALALDAVAQAGLELEVAVVLGSQAPHLSSVNKKVAALAGATLHIDPDNVAELMSDADIAIGACGSSSWERCCLGLPVIGIVCAEDQRWVGAALKASGAGVIADDAATGPDWIAARLRDFSANGDLLRRTSANAAARCDGEGTRRVMETIITVSKGATVHG